MKVAFYSPLKPPNHWRPSGDRRIARLFARALAAAGCDVQLASARRSWNGRGDARAQSIDADRGTAIGEHLARRWRTGAQRPDVWFTYHAYHKAPDWIGPGVCRSLELPYVVAEASIAHKRAAGDWGAGYQQTLRALQSASAIISLNPDDEVALRELVPVRTLFQMAPFMESPPAARPPSGSAPNITRLVATGMMRPGDKLESYRQLASSLARMRNTSWYLTLIGDGRARAEVQRLFAPFAERVEFAGELDIAAVSAALVSADLFVWPAHNEALGMALLEAHAHGLPVIAGLTPGVQRIVTHERTGLLCAPGDTDAMAGALDRLIDDPVSRQRMGAEAREKFEASHTLTAATETLRAVLARATHD